MHTIKRQTETEWLVGRVERGEFGDEFIPMFGGLGLGEAVKLLNCLNGGHALALSTMSILSALWRYAEEGKR